MASITFDATLNTDKLEYSMKQSNKTIKDWSKGVEEAGTKADRSFSKMGVSLKETIKHQKEYIKGLTVEIKEMQKVYDRIEAGRAKGGKGGMGEQLSQAKRRLSEATRELTNMEKEYGNTGVEANEKIEKSSSKLKAAYVGLIAAIGSAMVAFRTLKREVMESEKGLNNYNITLAASKQLIYDIVHRTPIKEWIGNMKEVAKIQGYLNDLRKIERESLEEAEIYQISYNKFLYEAKDQTKSVTERIKNYDYALTALNKSIDIENENTATRLALVKEWLKTAKEKEPLLEEESKLTLELLHIENKRWSSQKEISSMRSGLVKTAIEEELKIRNELELSKLKGIDKELLALKQKYNQDLKAHKDNESIKAALTEKYALDRYEIEMKYLDKIKKENTKMAEALEKLDPGTGYAILGRALTKKPSPLKPTIQTREDIDKQIIKNLKIRLDFEKKLVYEATNFVYQMGESLGLSDEYLSILNDTLGTVEKIAEGIIQLKLGIEGAAEVIKLGTIQFALSVLSRIIGTFAQMRDVMSEPKWKKQIEAWDALIERQKRVIELSERTGGAEAALIEAKRIAQEKYDAAIDAVIAASERRGTVTQELLDVRNQAREELENATQALNDFLTGGITQIDIAGIIAQGFEDGKKSAKDFADDFDDLMRNAINTSLEELSKPSITAWYKKFAADMASAGGLDAGEIVALKKQWDDIIAAEEERRKQIYAIAGITETAITHPGLTGQIRRDITEETGTELAGLFRRFADEQRVVKDYSIQGVSHLVGIEANTYNTVEELKNAVVELQAININTKQVPVGGLG